MTKEALLTYNKQRLALQHISLQMCLTMLTKGLLATVSAMAGDTNIVMVSLKDLKNRQKWN